MPEPIAVDVHAHHLGTDVPEPGPDDPSAPRLVVDSESAGRIMLGDVTFRAVTSILWDVETRLREMDEAGVSHQVVSPVPVTMEHAWSRATDPAYAKAINDSVAAACDRSGGRLWGLGCLPLADVGEALDELARCLGLGLRGVEIGSRVGELDLDAPELDAFWAACDRSGAAVLVHPIMGGQGVVRRAGQPYDLGLGMLTDTAIAASSLVFGGVLERHPNLRVALAHGCGAFPWAYPRLRVAAGLGGRGDPSVWDALTRRLYADTLVFDDEHLRLLVHRFGADRLLLGSDTPFFADQVAKSMRSVDEAVASGALPTDAGHARLARNAMDFLGLGS
ncbi:amidohydrolase [Pseudonocardia sp. RS11V-5]|uniref:amidohydrolase family protein n=1 Tax=Pseudonocardia terrae TaxID=2905831 RepID=UPI001E617117|nr:amidohydrolase family protein [Pseudonocardia terrae]MCE3554490.1 amidohydrolase [Pseudonocardia terrae]